MLIGMAWPDRHTDDVLSIKDGAAIKIDNFGGAMIEVD